MQQDKTFKEAFDRDSNKYKRIWEIVDKILAGFP